MPKAKSRTCRTCGAPLPSRDTKSNRPRVECHSCRTGRGQVLALFIRAATPRSMRTLDIPPKRLHLLLNVPGWEPVQQAVLARFGLDYFDRVAWGRFRSFLQARYPTREKALRARFADLAVMLAEGAPADHRPDPTKMIPEAPAPAPAPTPPEQPTVTEPAAQQPARDDAAALTAIAGLSPVLRELLRELWNRPSHEASIDDLVTALVKPPSDISRVHGRERIEQQCKRARKDLEVAGAPIRLERYKNAIKVIASR